MACRPAKAKSPGNLVVAGALLRWGAGGDSSAAFYRNCRPPCAGAATALRAAMRPRRAVQVDASWVRRSALFL